MSQTQIHSDSIKATWINRKFENDKAIWTYIPKMYLTKISNYHNQAIVLASNITTKSNYNKFRASLYYFPTIFAITRAVNSPIENCRNKSYVCKTTKHENPSQIVEDDNTET